MDSGGLRYFTENPFPRVLNVTPFILEKRVIIFDSGLFYGNVDLISQSLVVHPSFTRPSPGCEFFRFVSLSNINFLRSGVSQ